MSTVSFPNHSHQRTSSTVQEDFFGSSYNPSSSFQMNPLSPHPPRTPRTSIVSPSDSYVYGSEVYASSMAPSENKAEKRAEVEEYTEDEVAEEVEEVVSEAAVKRVKAPEVWREVLKTSSGRDKAFVS